MRLSVFCPVAPAAIFLLSGCASALREYETSHALLDAPLATYVRSCMQPRSVIGQDGLAAVRISPAVTPHHRPLVLGDRSDSVSVRTGHRVMYAFNDAGYFFANVKIEQSNVEEYDRDKEAIVRQLRTYEDTASIYSERVLNGLPVHSFEGSRLDDGGTIGIYTSFLDRDHLVITAYLLNQGPKNRRFRTMEEYRALRDRFLDDLTTCVGRVADSPGR